MSGYDVPVDVTLHLPDYTWRKALVQYWYGTKETWTPEGGFTSLAITASGVRSMQPYWDAHIGANALAAWLAEQMGYSLYIHAEWATGDPTEIDEWLADFEADYSHVKWFIDANEHNPLSSYVNVDGGPYSIYVYIINDIVAAYDTEEHAWFFPSGTPTGPEVKDYMAD